MPSMLNVAKQYLDGGWSVIPLQPKQKEPLPGLTIRTYQRERKPTAGEIAAWWGNAPNANIGICTGSISGIFVLDCDSPLAVDYVESLGFTTPSLYAKTGKGRHYYFKYPDFPVGNRADLLKGDGPRGIDVRGDGGYVVGPPSIHPNGAVYEFPEDLEVASAPYWLLDKLRPDSLPPSGGANPPPVAPRQPTFGGYAVRALNEEAAKIATASEGSRNDCLNRSAFKLGQLVGAGLLNESDVRQTLTQAAIWAGLDELETFKTIRSGLEAGKANPRQVTLRKADRQ